LRFSRDSGLGNPQSYPTSTKKMKKEPRKEVERMAKKWMDYSMIV
jgi:hypothetical protein